MRNVKMNIVALLLLVLISLRPVPAAAAACCETWSAVAWVADQVATSSETGQEIVQWANKFAQWAAEFGQLATQIASMVTLNTSIDTSLQTVGAITNAGQQAQTEAEVRVGVGAAQSDNQTRGAQATAAVAGATTPPPMQNQQLCNVIIARQGPVALHWFTQMVQGKISDMIASRYRGVGTDGAGQQYASDERSMRCGDPGIPGSVKTANSLDGYDASCIPTNKDLIDADISARTLDFSNVLVMPPMVSKSYTTPSGTVNIKVPTPDPLTQDYDEQQMWVAATNYCYFAAGPRPSPPANKDLDSPEGITQTAAFDHAMALESAFVSQCAHRVAYITRARSDDPAFSAVGAAGMSACAAARNADVEIPSGIICNRGLSEYQAEYLSHLICMSSQNFTAGSAQGITQGQMMQSTTLCELSMSRWQARLARESANLSNSLKALQEMRRVYQGSGATAGKTMRIKAPGDLAPRPRNRQKAANDAANLTPASFMQRPAQPGVAVAKMMVAQ